MPRKCCWENPQKYKQFLASHAGCGIRHQFLSGGYRNIAGEIRGIESSSAAKTDSLGIKRKKISFLFWFYLTTMYLHCNHIHTIDLLYGIRIRRNICSPPTGFIFVKIPFGLGCNQFGSNPGLFLAPLNLGFAFTNVTFDNKY